MLNPQISRREFLKLVSTGSLAFALHDLRIDRALEVSPPTQGRITWSGVPLYDAPAFQANQIHHFGAKRMAKTDMGTPTTPCGTRSTMAMHSPVAFSLWKPDIKSPSSPFLRKDN
jgi:hypothetical protein